MPRCDFCNFAVLFVWVLLQFALGHSQMPAQETTSSTTIHPGRYRPEIHGADRGIYMPDDSGKYRHMKVPYNGGYGDRGLEYVHDLRALAPTRATPTSNGFVLGPKDHLRFSVDFNTNSKGWEIVDFDWIRDGEEGKQYKYEHQEPLRAGVAVAAGATTKAADVEPVTGYIYGNTNVHLAGEYENKIYNVSYSNDNKQNAPSQSNIQATIREVLEYIQTNILPTLS